MISTLRSNASSKRSYTSPRSTRDAAVARADRLRWWAIGGQNAAPDAREDHRPALVSPLQHFARDHLRGAGQDRPDGRSAAKRAAAIRQALTRQRDQPRIRPSP